MRAHGLSAVGRSSSPSVSSLVRSAPPPPLTLPPPPPSPPPQPSTALAPSPWLAAGASAPPPDAAEVSTWTNYLAGSHLSGRVNTLALRCSAYGGADMVVPAGTYTPATGALPAGARRVNHDGTGGCMCSISVMTVLSKGRRCSAASDRKLYVRSPTPLSSPSPKLSDAVPLVEGKTKCSLSDNLGHSRRKWKQRGSQLDCSFVE